MTTTEYIVTGMTCGNCENHVREEVGQVAGAEHVEVSHKTGKLTVTSNGPEIDHAAVLAAVDEAGYSAVLA